MFAFGGRQSNLKSDLLEIKPLYNMYNMLSYSFFRRSLFCISLLFFRSPFFDVLATIFSVYRHYRLKDVEARFVSHFGKRLEYKDI